MGRVFTKRALTERVFTKPVPTVPITQRVYGAGIHQARSYGACIHQVCTHAASIHQTSTQGRVFTKLLLTELVFTNEYSESEYSPSLYSRSNYTPNEQSGSEYYNQANTQQASGVMMGDFIYSNKKQRQLTGSSAISMHYYACLTTAIVVGSIAGICIHGGMFLCNNNIAIGC